jgi:tRNA threonylcarbamoyladenosine biosynthesis protein TsaE
MGQVGGFGMQITTHSADETQALGQRLAKRLLPGDVIAYFGDLGAGKTALTRGIAQGLGVTDLVTSPTYTIVNEYLTGRIPLFHFDMYRLGSSDELFDIGWEDYLARGGVCAVEWSENVEDALRDAIHITIEKDPLEPDTRRITIEGGSRFEAAGI